MTGVRADARAELRTKVRTKVLMRVADDFSRAIGLERRDRTVLESLIDAGLIGSATLVARDEEGVATRVDLEFDWVRHQAIVATNGELIEVALDEGGSLTSAVSAVLRDTVAFVTAKVAEYEVQRVQLWMSPAPGREQEWRERFPSSAASREAWAEIEAQSERMQRVGAIKSGDLSELSVVVLFR